MQGIIKKRTWSTSLEFHQAFHRVRNGKARFRHNMSWFFSNLTIVATRRYILPLLTQRSRTHYFIIAHNQFLFDISKGKTKKGRLRRIILPNTVADFLNISKANTWREMFENPAIFKPIKKGKDHNFDLYIGLSSPVSNIFYLLQIFAPGMLIIYYEYQLHNANIKVSKLLPQVGSRQTWIYFFYK